MTQEGEEEEEAEAGAGAGGEEGGEAEVGR